MNMLSNQTLLLSALFNMTVDNVFGQLIFGSVGSALTVHVAAGGKDQTALEKLCSQQMG